MTPEEPRITTRVDARNYARQVLAFIDSEAESKGPEWTIAVWETVRDEALLAIARLVPTEKRPAVQQPAPSTLKARERDLPTDVVAALEIIEEMEELAENIPDTAQEFAESVLERAKSIGRTIEWSEGVTRPQEEALENMRDGLAKWVRD